MNTKKALIVGGHGQIGLAAATELSRAGWNVTAAARHGRQSDPELDALGVEAITLDRADTAALLAAASGCDLVLDVVAFGPEHAVQLRQLEGDVGSLVVISSGAVYAGVQPEDGAVSDGDRAPIFPVPIGEDDATLSGDGRDYGSRKAAMERALMEAEELPVSILRPGTMHGPRSNTLHHWAFIKRVIDNRPHLVLAYDGESRFATSATANLAHLVRLCAEHPGRRILNAGDDQTLTVAEIGRRVLDSMGSEAEIFTFPGPEKEDGLGFNPWNTPHPLVLSMDRAREELGYRESITYDDALTIDIEWALGAVAAAEAEGRDWTSVFSGMVARFGPDGWFPYAVEDEYVASR